MNNGHLINQDLNETGFFTAGIGSVPENQNPLPDDSNLESDTFFIKSVNSSIGQAAIDSSAAKHLHPSSLGSAALYPSSETSTANEANISSGGAASPELGQIVELSMPPLVGESGQPIQTDDAGLDTVSISRHFADEKISKSDIDYIKSQEAKLAQDGNAADFYNFWQTARLDAMSGVTSEDLA